MQAKVDCKFAQPILFLFEKVFGKERRYLLM